jgi:metal-responsive CopG/Arc/MetJ family transcriptional regulator
VATKINVSISADLLKRLDEAAREAGFSRSALLSEAVIHHLAAKEEEKKKVQRRQAAARIIQIAEKIGPWDGTTEILKWRDQH